MEFLTTKIPSVPKDDETAAAITSYMRAQKRDINFILEQIDKDKKTVTNSVKELKEDINEKVPFGLAWHFCDGDFMALVDSYCTSGSGHFVIIQIGHNATNRGKLPLYSLVTLITNGRDRHRLSALGGSTASGFEAFNEEDKYSSDGWRWMQRSLTEV